MRPGRVPRAVRRIRHLRCGLRVRARRPEWCLCMLLYTNSDAYAHCNCHEHGRDRDEDAYAYGNAYTLRRALLCRWPRRRRGLQRSMREYSFPAYVSAYVNARRHPDAARYTSADLYRKVWRVLFVLRDSLLLRRQRLFVK